MTQIQPLCVCVCGGGGEGCFYTYIFDARLHIEVIFILHIIIGIASYYMNLPPVMYITGVYIYNMIIGICI